MKTADSLEPKDTDHVQHSAESPKLASLASNQSGEQPSPSATSQNIFYDGREVYGGY
jgi:hypothetical protein